MRNEQRLVPAVFDLLDKTDKERIEFIKKDKWIEYTAAKVILSKMENLLADPERQRKKFILIEAKSNNGKTTLIRRFLEQHPSSRVDGNLRSPVILIESPTGPSLDQFYSNILFEIYCPTASTATGKKNQLKITLPKVHAKMLLIDNFHDFRFGNNNLKMRYLAEVRKLANDKNISLSIVATATYIARNIIKRDPQLYTRFLFLSLPIWKQNNDLKNLLWAFEKILPLKKPSGLTNDKIFKRIVIMSEGILGNVEEILQDAAEMAIETGKEKIDEEILKAIPFNTKHEPQAFEEDEYPQEDET